MRFVWLLTLATVASCQNIDIDRPIVREVSGLAANGSLFGYSLVLHQTVANASSRAEALGGARIIVSAPKGTAPEMGAVPNTGLVYSCPINPGNCSGLPGKLFDTTPNNPGENKADQFLGASMASNGERFVVCAHRHITSQPWPPSILPQGKCFISGDRSLNRQFQEYQPCLQSRSPRGNGFCQVGTSLVIVPDGAFGFGAPGINYWRGAIIRRNRDGTTSFQGTSSGTNYNSYQGYAITAGRFMTTSRQDFAVSLPRRNRYFGSVNLVMNDNSFVIASQPLTGMQMGEYFGFSLLAVDLNGDNYDELLVGAPLFRMSSTKPEIGRVYLYRNSRGNLQFVRTIEGRTRYSRFGHAMANLGDINGDGFDDVAISAPFAETNSSEPGTVFIYHSTPNLLLSNEPQQVIRGTDLRLNQDLSDLKGFGTSLASGVDVDRNTYNDLLIGSFLSQKVFLLRTRPLAYVQTEFTASKQIIDVLDRTGAECMISGTNYACLNLTACANYSGLQVADTLNFSFNVSGDTQSFEKRIFFENNSTTLTKEVIANISTRSCIVFTTYIRSDSMDLFNPFVIELNVTTPSREVTPGNGNEMPEDLTGFPVVIVTPPTPIQIETLKQCGGGNSTCIPDLRIDVSDSIIFNRDQQNSSSTFITAGLTSSVDIFLDIENSGEDAFRAILSFILPTSKLQLINVFNQTRNGEVTLRCLREPLQGQQLGTTRHNCSIGNPFSTPLPRRIQLRVRIDPRNIFGNEEDVLINFTVSSLNPENTTTILDNSNFAVVELNFEARANITIDNGVVTPEQISYSDNSAISEGDALTNVTQLGPPVDVSFLIRNSGPSRIANIQLDILWPLNSTLTAESYYLYITSVKSTGGATVICHDNYINPMKLGGDESDDQNQQEGGDPTVSMGTGRRKKRSTVKRTLRNKRQEAPTEQDLTEDRVLTCMSPGPILNCVNIRCNLLGLPGSSSVQVDINSRLDERFFSTNNDRYTLTPTASISIIDGDYIESNDGSSQRSADAQILVIPASRVITVGEATPVPWWAIFLPILAAMIIISVVAILLWVFGFFRRKKHEEIKQQREQLQNLTAHGVSPGDGGSEPMELQT